MMKRSYIYIHICIYIYIKHANFAHWTKYVHINTARLYLGFWSFNTNAKCCIQFCQKVGVGGGWGGDSAPTFSKSLGASSPIERLYWKYIRLKARDNSHVMHQYDKNLHLLSNIKCVIPCVSYTIPQSYQTNNRYPLNPLGFFGLNNKISWAALKLWTCKCSHTSYD